MKSDNELQHCAELRIVSVRQKLGLEGVNIQLWIILGFTV
jgi:hypothetical protein